MNTENKPVYFTKDQLKQHLESRGINTNAKAQPIIDQLVQKGAVIEGYNDQPKPNLAQTVAGGFVKAPTDIIGAGFAGIGALGSYTGKKLAGQDTTLSQEYQNQSKQVQESGANSIMQPITGEQIRPAQNLEELGGDVLQTAALAIPGGAVGKGASTLGKIGAGLGYGAATGGAAGAGMAMSENATLEDIIKQGAIGASIGGALGAAIPAIPAVYGALKKTPDVYQAAKGLRNNVQAYAGSKSVQPTFGTAATRLTGSATRLETPLASYQKYEPMAMQAIADTKVDAPISVVGSEIGDAFKKVIDSRRAVGNVMGQELKTVGKLKTNIEPIFVNFETALKDAGLTYNGLSKKIIASDLSKVAPEDIAIIEDFVGELNRIGTTPKVAQIDALVSRMNDKISYAKSASGMINTTNGERLIKATLNSLRNTFDEIPELATYSQARKTYAELSNFIDEGAGFLGKITQSGDFAKDASIAKSAVQSILNNGKKDWLLKLEALTDYPALDEATLALQAMKDAGDFRGLSLLETLSETSIPTSKAGFTQKLIDFLAEKGSNIVTGSPAERTKAYLKSLEGKSLNKTVPTNINIKTAIPANGVKKMPINNGIKKSEAVMNGGITQATRKASGKLISDESYQQTLKEFKKNLGNMNSGIDPVQLGRAVKLATYHVQEGAITLADFTERMIKDGIKVAKNEYEKLFARARFSQMTDDEFITFQNFIDNPTEATRAKALTMASEMGFPDKTLVGTNFKKMVKDGMAEKAANMERIVPALKGKQGISKELLPLAEEAKKYKSAEEFIKAQPKLYHGTTANFKEFKASGSGEIGKGVYFYDDAKRAENYAGNDGRIIEGYVSGKWATLEDFRKVRDELGDNGWTNSKTIDELSKRGFVGIKRDDGGTVDYNVFNPKDIITKEQLIKLYKKVNK